MTKLDSILKSRDITLPTEVRLVKAMVFPVVMYGCESWNVKKAERRRIDALGAAKIIKLVSYSELHEPSRWGVVHFNICFLWGWTIAGWSPLGLMSI